MQFSFDLGVVGTGPMAALHVQAFAEVPGVRLAACASRSIEKAEAFAARHGIARAATIDEFLLSPKVDALLIVVPAIHMAGMAMRACETGLPLLLEKPVGMSAEETEAVLGLVCQPNMVALNRRHYEVIREAKRLIEDAGGARFVEVHMPEDVASLASIYGRETLNAWQYGNSVHLIDLFRFFAGEATEVRQHNAVRDWWDRSYCGFVDFRSGARGLFHAQWYAPGPWRVAVYSDNLSVIFAPIEEGLVLRSPGRQRNRLAPIGLDTRLKPGLYGQAIAFAELVRTGRLPEGSSDMADYAKSVALVRDLTEPGVHGSAR